MPVISIPIITQEELTVLDAQYRALRALAADIHNRRFSIASRLKIGAILEPGDLWFHRRLEIVLRRSELLDQSV